MRNEIWRLDKAERTEIGMLIRRLSRPDRINWLIWCCTQVSQGAKQVFLADVIGTERETWEHWKALCFLHNLNVRESRAELERRVQLNCTPLLIGVR